MMKGETKSEKTREGKEETDELTCNASSTSPNMSGSPNLFKPYSSSHPSPLLSLGGFNNSLS